MVSPGTQGSVRDLAEPIVNDLARKMDVDTKKIVFQDPGSNRINQILTAGGEYASIAENTRGQVSTLEQGGEKSAKALAERFQALSPRERAEDPDLRNAQAQLSAFAATIRERVAEPERRQNLTERVDSEITKQLAQGAAFKPVQVIESAERATPTPTRPERER